MHNLADQGTLTRVRIAPRALGARVPLTCKSRPRALGSEPVEALTCTV